MLSLTVIRRATRTFIATSLPVSGVSRIEIVYWDAKPRRKSSSFLTTVALLASVSTRKFRNKKGAEFSCQAGRKAQL